MSLRVTTIVLLGMFAGPALGAPEAPCRACRATVQLLPIAYGKPGPDLMERARQGEVVLGGCEVAPWRWACARCDRPLDTPDIDWSHWAEQGERASQARKRWLRARR